LMAYGCEGALTLGAHGAIAFDAIDLHYSPAREVANIVDLSGAGDQFVAGYLSGMRRSLPLATCVDLGQLGASAVIGHEGARPQTDLLTLVEQAGIELDRPL
jgi:sugar/nucleoside kinase (ribokinase family)